MSVLKYDIIINGGKKIKIAVFIFNKKPPENVTIRFLSKIDQPGTLAL